MSHGQTMQDSEKEHAEAIRQKYLELGGARWLNRTLEELKKELK